MAKEITVELTDEQYKHYRIMQENGLSIGEAIELIFYLRDQYGVRNDQLLEERLAQLNIKKERLENEQSDKDVSAELEKVNKELEVVKKISNDEYDYDAKAKILEKEYGTIDESYEMKVQAHMREIRWGKFFSSLKYVYFLKLLFLIFFFFIFFQLLLIL